MIFDEQGFPRDTGATDFKDSARLAGMMAIVGDPRTPNLAKYFWDGLPVRHPMYSTSDFSRDQLLCLVAGIKMQGLWHSNIHLYKPTNGDWISPSHKDHLRRCARLPDTWLGRQWLKLDILFHAKVTPLAEPNQLIAMLIIAGPEWVKRWTDANQYWRTSIANYWCTWRGEGGLADDLITKIEAILQSLNPEP